LLVTGRRNWLDFARPVGQTCPGNAAIPVAKGEREAPPEAQHGESGRTESAGRFL